MFSIRKLIPIVHQQTKRKFLTRVYPPHHSSPKMLIEKLSSLSSDRYFDRRVYPPYYSSPRTLIGRFSFLSSNRYFDKKETISRTPVVSYSNLTTIVDATPTLTSRDSAKISLDFSAYYDTCRRIEDDSVKIIVTEDLDRLRNHFEKYNKDVEDTKSIKEDTLKENLEHYIKDIHNIIVRLKKFPGNKQDCERAIGIFKRLDEACQNALEFLFGPHSNTSDLQLYETVWRSYRLRAEQMFLQNNFDGELKNTLNDIEKKAKRNGYAIPKGIYICYAWPDKKDIRDLHLFWLQPFLSCLYQHLENAGFHSVMLDIKDNFGCGNIHEYMKQVRECEYVLVVGTETLLRKHNKGVSAVCSELVHIDRKRAEDSLQGKFRVLPLLLSGEIDTSLPSYYEKYTSIVDWKSNQNYLINLRSLICALYQVSDSAFKQEWDNFCDKHPNVITNSFPLNEVKKQYELALVEALQVIKSKQNEEQLEISSLLIPALQTALIDRHSTIDPDFQVRSQQSSWPWLWLSLAGIFSGLGIIIGYYSLKNWRYAHSVIVGNKYNFPEYIEQTEEHARLLEALNEPHPANKNKMIILNGMQGTGKSFTASYMLDSDNLEKWFKPGGFLKILQPYIEKQPWLVIYFKASLADPDNSKFSDVMLRALEQIKERYESYSSDLGIFKTLFAWFASPLLSKNIDKLREERTKVLKDFKEYLEQHPGWVIVLDDIRTWDGITITKGELFFPEQGGTVIITTNNLGLNHASAVKIKFNGFSESETRKYIYSRLKDSCQQLEEGLFKQFVAPFAYKITALNDPSSSATFYSPLSLNQACNLIATGVYSIPKYLEIIEKHPHTLLGQGSNDNDHPALSKTLDISLEYFRSRSVVKSYSIVGNFCPEELLLFIATSFNHIDIPEYLLRSIFCAASNETEEAYYKAKQELQRFQMITITSDEQISMHLLLHKIFRDYFYSPLHKSNNQFHVLNHKYWQLRLWNFMGFDTLIDHILRRAAQFLTLEPDDKMQLVTLQRKLYIHLLVLNNIIKEVSTNLYQEINILNMLRVLAEQHYNFGEFNLAEETYKRTLKKGINSPMYFSDLGMLASAYGRQGRVIEMHKLLNEGLRYAKMTVANKAELIANLKLLFAISTFLIGEMRQSKLLLEEVMDFYGDNIKDRENMIRTLLNYAYVLTELNEGNPYEYVKRANELAENLPAPKASGMADPIAVKKYQFNIINSLVLNRIGKSREAEPIIREALKKLEDFYGRSNHWPLLACWALTEICYKTGRFTEAKLYGTRAWGFVKDWDEVHIYKKTIYELNADIDKKLENRPLDGERLSPSLR